MPKSANDQRMDRINARVERCETLAAELKRMLDELYRPPPPPRLTLVTTDEEGDDG